MAKAPLLRRIDKPKGSGVESEPCAAIAQSKALSGASHKNKLGGRAMAANRFFDIDGDVSIQLAPWKLQASGKPLNIARFVLQESLRYRSDIAGGVIIVPAGYESDLASIPQFAWSLFMAPDDPRIELGSWVHDYLYSNEGKISLEDGTAASLTRKQADRILAKEAMPELLATDFQCTVVYWSTRLFGGKWSNESFWERFS